MIRPPQQACRTNTVPHIEPIPQLYIFMRTCPAITCNDITDKGAPRAALLTEMRHFFYDDFRGKDKRLFPVRLRNGVANDAALMVNLDDLI